MGFSNHGAGSSGNGLPSGYEWRKDSGTGDLQLWKTDVSPNILITAQNIGEFDVNGSLRANINTVYLEQAHAISSAGEEVTFRNLETGAHYTPVWGLTSEDGTVVGKATALEEDASTSILNINGFPHALRTVPCTQDYPITANQTVYSYTVKSAESYSGKVKLEVFNSLGDRVFAVEKSVSLSVGSDLTFSHLLYRVRVGNVRTVKVSKSDGTLLEVYAGQLVNTEPYVNMMVRGFVDREIVTVGSDGKIPSNKLPDIDTIDRVVVANQAARLALPASNKFIIAIQSDVQRQFYLEGGQNPSVLANWVDGGSTAASVTAFNGRTGAVVPQSGDYTAAQVGAVASPANDGARRVFVGNTPTLEAIVDNLTSTSSSSPLSAAQGKVLQDSKQAAITGAATTITSSNLTVSRALASDASGKVAVSSVTSTELGYLSGATSSVQTQLNGKQATITGAASTIATANLTASRAVASDATGKVVVSAVTSTELGYLSGVTSAIQTQLNSKSGLILVSQAEYVLSATQALSIGTVLLFNTLSYSIVGGFTNASGVFTLPAGFYYTVEGFGAHNSTVAASGLAFQLYLNGAYVGTSGGSAVANSGDSNMGPSSPARWGGLVSTASTIELRATGWQNMSASVGNSNIPASYIRITQYKQI